MREELNIGSGTLSFYLSTSILVLIPIAIHPQGVETNNCLDFRLDPNAEVEEQWSPEGYSWYDGELIRNRQSRSTRSEQLFILENHPFFTGVCPQCRHEFNRDERIVHYDCPECSFTDSLKRRCSCYLKPDEHLKTLQVGNPEYCAAAHAAH